LLAVPAVSVQVYVPLVLTIAACEAAVGLGLVSVSYWRAGTTKLEHFENLKG
jgi:NADH:ubiquinone oxidoreductase subunit K